MSLDKDKLFYNCHVFCCVNERPPGHKRGCCAEKDAIKLQSYMKARAKEKGLKDIRINKSGCLDRCELGPVMVVYPDGIWYRYETQDDIDEILSRHVADGEIVERLKLEQDD